MESVLKLIFELVNWFWRWVPQVFQVRISERAIRYVRGRAEIVEPGIHVYWPITTEIDQVFVTPQTLKLRAQAVNTNDGITVEVGCFLVYSIEDAYKYLVENYDAKDTTREVALSAVRRAVGMRTFAQLREGRADIDNTLASQARQKLAPLGVKVETLEITDLAKTRVLSLFGRGQRDEHESEGS